GAGGREEGRCRALPWHARHGRHGRNGHVTPLRLRGVIPAQAGIHSRLWEGPERALFFLSSGRIKLPAEENALSMRILVAEDDAVLAEGVMRTLRQSGHAVDWVKNGAEADCALAANPFDLLILDLGLPKRSGLDVLKHLRAGDSRLPVLILTALDGVRDRVRGLDAGADDYLAKPFDLAELEARVRALVRRGMA